MRAARIQHILSAVMAAAIRERRILSITYAGAVEPRMFAPVALYLTTSNRLAVDGYEVSGSKVRWRELALDSTRDVWPTEHTYVFASGVKPLRKSYPYGTAVLARATLDTASAIKKTRPAAGEDLTLPPICGVADTAQPSLRASAAAAE